METKTKLDFFGIILIFIILAILSIMLTPIGAAMSLAAAIAISSFCKDTTKTA